MVQVLRVTKMRFNLLVTGSLLLATALPGEVPAKLFQAHQADILSGKMPVVEAHSFGVGSASLRVDSSNGKQAAKGRSTLLAQVNLIANIKLANIDFPEVLTPEECSLLLRCMRQNMTDTVNLEGMQVIHQAWDDSEWISVVAIPTANTTHIAPYTFSDILVQCYKIRAMLPAELLQKLGIPPPPVEVATSKEQSSKPPLDVKSNETTPSNPPDDVRQGVRHNEDGSIETFNEALYF